MANLSNINNKFLVTTGGNVGIGVTGPITKLNVAGNIAVTAAKAYRMYNAANNGWGEMSFIEADNRIQFNRGIQNSGVDWRLSENSASSYVCALQGNFGIGTTSPSWNLQVAGRALVADTTARLPFYVSRAGGGAVTNAATIVSGAAAYFNGNIAGSDALRIGSMDNGTGAYYIDVSNYAGTAAYNLILQPFLGNVGIGTISPQQKLTLGSVSAGGIQFNYDSTNNYRHQILNYWNSNTDSRMDFNIARTSGQTPETIMSVGYGGNVGIAMTNPVAKLDVNGAIRASGGTYVAPVDTATNVALVIENADYIYTRDSAAYLRKLIGKPADNRIEIGQNGTSLVAGIDLYAGNSATGNYQFHQSTNIICTINSSSLTHTGDIVAYSDARLKSNVKKLDGSKVYNMRGVSFDKDGKKGSGVIAQEMQEIAPELVYDDGKYLGVAYGNLSGYLIEAIKELKAEIEELKLNNCNCNK